jgi:hypothetical protein
MSKVASTGVGLKSSLRLISEHYALKISASPSLNYARFMARLLSTAFPAPYPIPSLLAILNLECLNYFVFIP